MKTYLVTGGTGSLGSILCSKIIEQGDKVRALSHNEPKLAAMKTLYPEKQFTGIYGDIRNHTRVNFACRDVDYILHTAAMKNLVVTEGNVPELYLTNITGTQNIVVSAIEQGVRKAIFMSSDKAVSPSSAYGTSKQSGEWLWRWGSKIQKETAFLILRSGNFLESAGNVFELWKKQVSEGKPLTLTHIDMKRHFVPTEKVADILLTMIRDGDNGDLVVPKMTEYYMRDLLKDRYPCNEYIVTGLRPGEKLTEELTYDNEYIIQETEDYYIYHTGGK
jgi:UDP-N-acetylglucosamine 4,6-dehydratase